MPRTPQHPENAEGRLTDALDSFNDYIIASLHVKSSASSVSRHPARKVFDRQILASEELPFPSDDQLYEVRLLTVPRHIRPVYRSFANVRGPAVDRVTWWNKNRRHWPSRGLGHVPEGGTRTTRTRNSVRCRPVRTDDRDPGFAARKPGS